MHARTKQARLDARTEDPFEAQDLRVRVPRERDELDRHPLLLADAVHKGRRHRR